MALEAKHYSEEIEALKKEPAIIAMAKGLEGEKFAELAHGPDSPKFEFMLAANAEYKARTGKAGGAIGAVGRALLALAFPTEK